MAVTTVPSPGEVILTGPRFLLQGSLFSITVRVMRGALETGSEKKLVLFIPEEALAVGMAIAIIQSLSIIYRMDLFSSHYV